MSDIYKPVTYALKSKKILKQIEEDLKDGNATIITLTSGDESISIPVSKVKEQVKEQVKEPVKAKLKEKVKENKPINKIQTVGDFIRFNDTMIFNDTLIRKANIDFVRLNQIDFEKWGVVIHLANHGHQLSTPNELVSVFSSKEEASKELDLIQQLLSL